MEWGTERLVEVALTRAVGGIYSEADGLSSGVCDCLRNDNGYDR